jgi:hypothetical protein
MKQLNEVGFKYCQPKGCSTKIWYNKDTDMQVIKWSKKELRDMEVPEYNQYELIAIASNPKKSYVEEYFETIKELIDYLK